MGRVEQLAGHVARRSARVAGGRVSEWPDISRGDQRIVRVFPPGLPPAEPGNPGSRNTTLAATDPPLADPPPPATPSTRWQRWLPPLTPVRARPDRSARPGSDNRLNRRRCRRHRRRRRCPRVSPHGNFHFRAPPTASCVIFLHAAQLP